MPESQAIAFAHVADLAEPAALSLLLGPVARVGRLPLGQIGYSGVTHDRLHIRLRGGERTCLFLKWAGLKLDWRAARSGDELGREVPLVCRSSASWHGSTVPPGLDWRVDETCARVRGRRHRAIDGRGQIVDSYVSPTRGLVSARTSVERAIASTGTTPRRVISDEGATYPPALGAPGPDVRHGTGSYRMTAPSATWVSEGEIPTHARPRLGCLGRGFRA
jgi:hypothetical protein